ncbi:hypothetical protein CEXT_677891 [Caerostris extrusa]|uniref:Uncharacterized protein n=1 Tax=Caerostris extrusa TaxID=172846 RepID=A0AAV4UAZ4_CAEEX|nr:hypothetical protein CEXT_677891 [Caerostris extrusa]
MKACRSFPSQGHFRTNSQIHFRTNSQTFYYWSNHRGEGEREERGNTPRHPSAPYLESSPNKGSSPDQLSLNSKLQRTLMKNHA